MERERVDVDAGGLELDQGAVRGAGQLRGLPQPQRQADGGGLLAGQPDLGQLVVGAGDPVAVLGVEDAGAAGLQRDAHLAQFGLVPLEHALERLVGAVGAVVGLVAGHGGADPRRRHVLAGAQQRDDQVHQSLRPLRRHALRLVRPVAVRRRWAAVGRRWLACLSCPTPRLLLRPRASAGGAGG